MIFTESFREKYTRNNGIDHILARGARRISNPSNIAPGSRFEALNANLVRWVQRRNDTRVGQWPAQEDKLRCLNGGKETPKAPKQMTLMRRDRGRICLASGAVYCTH